MIVRVRGESGAHRLNVTGEMTLMELYQQVLEHVPDAGLGRFSLSFDPAGNQVIPPDEHLTIGSQPIQHGDLIHLRVIQQFYAKPDASKEKVREDFVDERLRKLDGKIGRGRDKQYCRHGDGAMCSHCMPLESFDSGYQKEKGIKHLSFHAYLRKLSTAQRSPGPLLEEADFGVKKNCPGHHAPYPEGICTKCQPSAIILNPQPFRMVDHVELDSPKLIEDFLTGWRRTGYQRFGWLLGQYDVYEGVPLGIKAAVKAIYEPPQDGSIDGFQLLEDSDGDNVLGLANSLNLSVLGMIYTDLTDDGSRSGKVLHKRSAETFFVSSAEAIFMAQNQLSRPSPCLDSSGGKFSSKFVTLVVTGNASNEIDFLAFQVSNTAEAMVSSDIIEATTDPNLVMVKPSVPKVHYVPEVMYKLQDEYKNTVQRKADPFFPVEYLLLTLSHGFPVRPDPFFRSPHPFPSLSDKPTMAAFKKYMEETRSMPLSTSLSNFNLLQYISVQGMLSPEELAKLAKSLINSDEAEIHNVTLNSTSWATYMTLAKEEISPSASASAGSDWTCPHCTFINFDRSEDSCEICGLPKS